MTSAIEAARKKRDAAASDVSRYASGKANAETAIAVILAQIDANKAVIAAKVRAEAMGDTFDGIVSSPAEIERLGVELEGNQQALPFFEAQLAGAKVNLDRAEGELRAAIGQHVRADIAPALLDAAKRSFDAAMKDLARLAAAEDWSIRLQVRQLTDYVPGNASQFITGMLRGTARNVYFDAGPGRGAWDVPGYAEQSALVEAAVRTMEARE